MPLELVAFADTAQPFLIHHSSIRGRVVRLMTVTDTILSRHAYPPVVSHLLAELLVVSTMLSANLKGKGIPTLQLKGGGPVKFLVVDSTAEGTLRGYAGFEESALPLLEKLRPNHARLSDVLGSGYIAITLDQGKEPYQGIVALSGETLTETPQAYFTHSEQSEVFVKTAVDYHEDAEGRPHWVAGGVILQHVPGEGGFGIAEGSQSEESPEEQWRRATALATTLKEEELTDLYLSPAQLLYRLFNEDGVWVYDAATVVAGCRCSRQKILATLQSFSAADLAEMAIDGIISVTCQFCNTTECFSEGLG